MQRDKLLDMSNHKCGDTNLRKYVGEQSSKQSQQNQSGGYELGRVTIECETADG